MVNQNHKMLLWNTLFLFFLFASSLDGSIVVIEMKRDVEDHTAGFLFVLAHNVDRKEWERKSLQFCDNF